MRIVITGASGFIGTPLAEKLTELGCEVLAISRTLPKNNSASSVFWYRVDLSSPATYRDKIKSFCPEVVIHLAWQDIPDFSFEKSIINLNHSLEFLSFVASIESCKKILVSGSCWEFNKTHGECLEADVGAPKDNFTWAKHSILSWLEMTCTQNNICLGWFRIFYVYGPGQRPDSLLPTILTNLKVGKLPKIKTPKNANDYIYVDDVVDAFSLATRNEFTSGLFNLGTGKSTSVLDVCRCAEKIVRGSDDLANQLEEEFKASTSDVDFWAGIKITKESLGWEPETTLVDGITRTWNSMNTL